MKMKRTIFMGTAAVLMLSAAVPAYAASPEFSRTAEEWAGLQDNVLEYGEIADLVHEYNATVKKNAIDLNEFRKDYGYTNDEWADKRRELADDLENALEEPDTDSATYGVLKAQIISNQMAADNYRKLADDALEDYQVKYYDYQAEEASITASAQTAMIQYYLNQISLEQAQKQLEILQETLQNTVKKQSLGSATATEVLLAEEKVKNQQKAVQDAQAAIENARQSLLVMLGWKHDDRPEIRPIPAVDETRIAAMNPAEDKAAAVENSYVMKSNRKKLENSRTQDSRDTLERTIRESEESIGTSVSAAYQDVMAKKTAYELSTAQSALEEKNLQTAERQYGLGMISRMQYVTQKNAAESARIAIEAARLNLFQSVQDYENMLNGSAG